MATVLMLAVLFGAYMATRIFGPRRLNPMSLIVTSWAPALVFTTVPYEIIHPMYLYLNTGVGALTYVSILFAFISFCLGSVVAHLVYRVNSPNHTQFTAAAMSSDIKLWQLFAIGLAIFVYSFAQSGLVYQLGLDPEEILDSRLALHLGPLSFAVLFLDVTSTVFMAKFMETKRKFYLLPAIITLVSYAATLQKSRVLFIVLSLTFICVLYPREAKELLFGSVTRKIFSVAAVGAVLALLLLMNAIRGIGLVSYTNFESPITEQLFIYSGSTAILNLASAVDERIAIDPPTFGLVLARAITRLFVDPELIHPTKYFGGINSSTFLIYPWSDFRWFGMLITPFLTGFLITVFIRLALKRTILGLMLGSIGFSATIFSVNTDFVFDPTTFIIIIVATAVHLYARTRVKRMNKAA